MNDKRYIVAQAPINRAWLHYLCAWHGNVPGWESRRDRALAFDERTASSLVGRFDVRYRCPASGLRHYIEEDCRD